MATAALLDFEALLAPIPGDDPAGSSLPFEIRARLEEDRKEIDPNSFDPSDPTRPEEPKRADWPSIIHLASETLTSASKDLQLAARLAEALTRQYHFAGLRDGLHLLYELVERCWDRLHPVIEDGDLEGRVSPFFWLDDPAKGACFPSTVRMLPVVFGPNGEPKYSCQDWKRSHEGKGEVTREDFEQAILTTPREVYDNLVEDIAQSSQELNQLTQCLHGKMGSEAPGLIALREAIEDCRRLVQQIGQQRPDAAGNGDISTEDGSGRDGSAPLTKGATRAEVYRQLKQAGMLLQQLEPHSPIPYLIQRAVELGSMPFPQLIRALIRDSNVLTELNRELGIKEPSSEE